MTKGSAPRTNMHLLASHYRSEFLATPQLVRIDYAKGSNGFEPTLLLKVSTLVIKYIALGAPLQLLLGRVRDRLMYAVTVRDDAAKPAMLWSVVETEAEVIALKTLVAGQSFPVFLFNELALNVAWSTGKGNFTANAIEWISIATLGKTEYPEIADLADGLLERAFKGTASTSELLTTDIEIAETWHPVFNHFITSHGTDSPIDIFSRDEGGQQEQLAIWLTDSLSPQRVHHSPQVPVGRRQRELTDILFSHDHGAVLIESKALTVFNRENLPDRAKLAKDVSQHVAKAARQLRGAIRKIKDGAPVTTRSGAPIDVERSQPAHAVVLIPEFGLIEDEANFDPEFIADFMKATGGFIHLLDLAELLRVVQAAEMLSRGSTKITKLMAFDYYLIERAKHAHKAETLCIEVLLHLQE
ncbi:MAG: hypothetical protein JNK17_13580 [Hydrogenophaga sp.]|nr:hypothetical protein [Hydrogenophaga sp.]